ncbi:MAG: reverse transcriptase-like protein [Bacteroidota bacterium]|nr:reverse transcriptase-like protein [Bacteroidota bacterium]
MGVGPEIIQVFTDGSCHTHLKIGAWAAIIFTDKGREDIKGIQSNTTHNQMELMSVIKALEWIRYHELEFKKIEVFSDSQYLVDIQNRKEKLTKNLFLTKAGKQVQNKQLLESLISYSNQWNVDFIKVISHQKADGNQNFNREVDIIVRKTLRRETRKSEFN